MSWKNHQMKITVIISLENPQSEKTAHENNFLKGYNSTLKKCPWKIGHLIKTFLGEKTLKTKAAL